MLERASQLPYIQSELQCLVVRCWSKIIVARILRYKIVFSSLYALCHSLSLSLSMSTFSIYWLAINQVHVHCEQPICLDRHINIEHSRLHSTEEERKHTPCYNIVDVHTNHLSIYRDLFANNLLLANGVRWDVILLLANRPCMFALLPPRVKNVLQNVWHQLTCVHFSTITFEFVCEMCE